MAIPVFQESHIYKNEWYAGFGFPIHAVINTHTHTHSNMPQNMKIKKKFRFFANHIRSCDLHTNAAGQTLALH